MIVTTHSLLDYALLAILIVLPLAILLEIARGVKAVCKHRQRHKKRVNLSLLRDPCEKMFQKPLPICRTKRVYLRESCGSLYWETYFGQQKMLDAANKGLTFKPVLEAIVEERRIVRVRRPSNNTYGPFQEYAYHSTTSSSKPPLEDLNVRESVGDDDFAMELDDPILTENCIEQDPSPLAPKKPVRFRPALETIVEERRFVRVRRPSKDTYGPFQEYAYHSTSTSSLQAPVTCKTFSSVMDDFDFSTIELDEPMDEPMVADDSLENDENTEASVRKRVINSTTSKKNLRSSSRDSTRLRRSTRVSDMKMRTELVFGSFVTKNGLRRSARIARL